MQSQPDRQAVVEIGHIITDEVPVGGDVVARESGLLAGVVVKGEDSPNCVGANRLQDGVHVVGAVGISLKRGLT